tara:strand:- start:17 stop:214 length:198 start_codon:yes stop_codon:yes gene_type:complete
MKWEYKRISDSGYIMGDNEDEDENGQTFDEFLEKLGNEGWEVFQIDNVTTNISKYIVYHLKRQKS